MLNIIVAHDESMGIGYKNKLPWKLPEDLKIFKEKTLGNSVIMGRKTWESLPFKQLPGRESFVVTSKADVLRNDYKKYSKIHFEKNLQDAIDQSTKLGKDVYIIGGASIYKQALENHKKNIDQMHITIVKGHYMVDTYLPNFDINNWWQTKQYSFVDFDIFVYYNRRI